MHHFQHFSLWCVLDNVTIGNNRLYTMIQQFPPTFNKDGTTQRKTKYMAESESVIYKLSKTNTNNMKKMPLCYHEIAYYSVFLHFYCFPYLNISVFVVFLYAYVVVVVFTDICRQRIAYKHIYSEFRQFLLVFALQIEKCQYILIINFVISFSLLHSDHCVPTHSSVHKLRYVEVKIDRNPRHSTIYTHIQSHKMRLKFQQSSLYST